MTEIFYLPPQCIDDAVIRMEVNNATELISLVIVYRGKTMDVHLWPNEAREMANAILKWCDEVEK